MLPKKWFCKSDRKILYRIIPLFCITILLFAQTSQGATGQEITANFQALIWAELVFVLGLAYHAGITINRVKNLEARIEDVEETKASEKLAALTATIEALKSEIGVMHEGVHDIKNFFMGIDKKQK